MKNFSRMICLMLALLMLTGSCAFAEKADKDWYIERADTLLADLHELSGSREYITYFTDNVQLAEQIAAWHESMSAEPVSVQRYLMPYESLIPTVLNIADVELPEAAQKRIGRGLGSTIMSTINGQQGVTFLAASTMLNISEGYVMPEGFEPCIVIYEYDGICVGVSFAEIGEGVVMAAAQICTKDVTMFLPRADALENAGLSSPLLSETPASEKTDTPSFERGTSKRGK